MICNIAPGCHPHGWCPECQHPMIAHRITGECAACNAFIELKPGMKVLVSIDGDYTREQVAEYLACLRRQFPGVEFTVLTNSTITIMEGGEGTALPPPLVRV